MVRPGDESWEDQVEFGDRWRDQQAGAYWVGPESKWVNHHAIGICVENDGTGQGPTDGQLKRLLWLARQLQARFQIPADRVILQVGSEQTSAGGRWFPVAWFRQQLLSFAVP